MNPTVGMVAGNSIQGVRFTIRGFEGYLLNMYSMGAKRGSFGTSSQLAYKEGAQKIMGSASVPELVYPKM